MRTMTLMLAAVVLFANLSIAQPRGYIAVGGGGSVADSNFSNGVSLPSRFETAVFGVDYLTEGSAIFDIGGGVVFGQFGLGVHLTRGSQTTDATMAISMPDPFRFNNNASDTATTPVDRRETGLHIQAIGTFPVSNNVSLTVFGGPSFFSASQELVTDMDVREVTNRLLPVHSIEITKPSSLREESGSAWGFNAGMDVAVYLTDIVGVGGGVRFTRASVPLPDLFQEIIGESVEADSDAGGLQLTGGVRFRF